MLFRSIKNTRDNGGTGTGLDGRSGTTDHPVQSVRIHWPEDRKLVELGSVKVESVVENHDKEQKYIIMDPIPRVQGIEPSDDPLLELRAAVYLISGRQRRAAE